MDPIITIPKPPEDSLSISVAVDKGQKRLLRNIGRYRALYLNGTITYTTITLKPGERYTVKKTKALVIQTNSGINAELLIGLISVVVPINQILVLDTQLEECTLTTLVETRVNLAYALQ